MKNSLIGLLIASLLLFPCKTREQENSYQSYDVPYVPTPEEVVEEMLKLADVGKDDIVYDLGCGDGRIVITAAKEMGAHGIGIDINPQRLKESRENAIKAKVTDKVEFREQNLFDTDFSEATVLTLYLLPNVNLKLRPKILRDMKPGSRIVSHDFNMGEWEPDKNANDNPNLGYHSVYFWIVPANVGGTWELTTPSDTGARRYTMELQQWFQKVQGSATTGNSKTELTDIKLTGDRLQFTMSQNVKGKNIPVQFEGRVNGNSMDGSMKSESGSIAGNRKWSANRDPSTVAPLDDSDQKEK
ncbi:MAG TPA: methyltransferase domain-containing protein [Anaerolineae bacterium]|nr:methyltransferase domain-containing protein [Anaerolineae bacterium]